MNVFLGRLAATVFIGACWFGLSLLFGAGYKTASVIALASIVIAAPFIFRMVRAS